jgi:membrane fusion protein (multidrug efflux system)
MNDDRRMEVPMDDSGVIPRKPRTAVRLMMVLGLTGLVFGAVFFMKTMGARGMNQYFNNMPVPPATITAAAAETMIWPNVIEAAGNFIPVNGTDVTMSSGGIVTAIHFESGGTVKAGALLLSLDSANEAGELKRLEAEAQIAELNRDRRERMVRLQAISQSDYDAAVANAKAAKATVEAQSAKLALKEIRAPFSGMLGLRRVNLGQYLAPGTPIVNLQSLDPIDVDFAVPEQRQGAITRGLPVKVGVDAYPGEEFSGQVLAVEPRVLETTRNFAVRARLANPRGRLRAGMFGRVAIVLPGELKVVAVPRTAVNYDPYGNSVFVIQKKTAPAAGEPAAAPQPAGSPPQTDLIVRQRFIKTGEARGDYVSIVEGLAPGEQVATSGLVKLRNDQPVIINNQIKPDVQLNPRSPEG